MVGFIYKISNSINNKVYIGKTLLSVEKRFQEHKKDSTRNTENIRPLYRAMNKYGCDCFFVDILEEVPIEVLSEREQFWIKYYDSYHNGYNATFGGDGKQLYNYNAIVTRFLDGYSVREIANEFGCCTETVCKALKLENINPKRNAIRSFSKSLAAYKNGQLIQKFNSRMEAVEWLQTNDYTKSTNQDNINAAIGRAANGQRKSAYGLQWKNL